MPASRDHRLESVAQETATPETLAYFVQALRSAAPEPELEHRFDELLPKPLRRLSRVHWTPINVVQKALELLAPKAGRKILDVGAGPGKFCIVASLLSEGTFVGVEQRPQLVNTARAMARKLDAAAQFICGNALDLDWAQFDGLYLYNPFGEQLFGPWNRIDESLRFSEAGFNECVSRTTAKLMEMPVGARVVLYQGYGGEMPTEYERQWRGIYGAGSPLELWVKVGS